MNRLAQRFRAWRYGTWEDWLFSHVPERVIDSWLGEFMFLDWLHPVFCSLIGHEPITDQCGMRAHDFCAYCNKPMPGLGWRYPSKQLERVP